MMGQKLIVTDGPTPWPELPEAVEGREGTVESYSKKGSNWIFDETALALIRSVDSHTVGQEICWLDRLYDKRIMRPLNASEMEQVLQVPSLDRDRWHPQIKGSRLIFAGTIYAWTELGKVPKEYVSCAWFDEEWRVDYLTMDCILRGHDAVPCVPVKVGVRIPASMPRKSHGVPRRTRIRPRFRGLGYPVAECG